MSKINKTAKLALFFMVIIATSKDCMAMAKTPKSMAQSRQSVQSNVQPKQSMIGKLKETAARHKGKIITGVGIVGAGTIAYLFRGAIGTIAEAKKKLIMVDAEVIDRVGAKLETSADDGIQQEVVDNNKKSQEIGQPIKGNNDETGHNQTSTTEADLNSTASIATSTEQTFSSKALTFINENENAFVTIGAVLLAVGARALWLVEQGTPSNSMHTIPFCAIVAGAAVALTPAIVDGLVPKIPDRIADSKSADASEFVTESHE